MCSIAVYYAALRVRWPYIQMLKLHTLTLTVIIFKSNICLKLKCQLKCNISKMEIQSEGAVAAVGFVCCFHPFIVVVCRVAFLFTFCTFF